MLAFVILWPTDAGRFQNVLEDVLALTPSRQRQACPGTGLAVTLDKPSQAADRRAAILPCRLTGLQCLYSGLVFGIELWATEGCSDADTRASGDPNVPDSPAVPRGLAL